MEVKGRAIMTLPLFIRENFGDEEYARWFDGLSAEAAEVYRGTIYPSTWYALKPLLATPTRLLCDMFYEGDPKGAWACGGFSADHALRGLLRLFVKVGSPGFIIKRARELITSYYKPSDLEIVHEEKDRTVLHLTTFPEIDPFIEARVCGWIEQALIIQGCRNLTLTIAKSLTRGESFSEYDIRWR
jgi:hypothetical protein